MNTPGAGLPPGSRSAEVERTEEGRRARVKVIARAAAALRCVSEETAGLTIVDVPHWVGLPHSATHRIVEALRREGFVGRDAARRVVIGPTVWGLACVDSGDVVREEAR